jgi:RNA polymerase sigma-70 factor (ECF subfamily)
MLYSSLSAEDLVRLCAETGENEAWQEFVRRFHTVIASSICRIARRRGQVKINNAVLDDLIQETYLKVCANDFRLLREFRAQHPAAIYAVLKVTAANVAHDYFRAKNTDRRGGGLEEQELSEVEHLVSDERRTGSARIERTGSAQVEREILLREIDAILSGVRTPSSARDREIFWLYYQQGFTAEAIAALAVFNLTTKGVESILHRLQKQVRASLVAGQTQMENAREASRSEQKARADQKGIGPQNTFMKGEGQP